LGAYTASRPETGLLIPSDYNNLSIAAAALIRATCTTEKTPDDVEQSRPGFALQKGHSKLSGEVGRTGGKASVEGFRFAMPQHDTPGGKKDTLSMATRPPASVSVDAPPVYNSFGKFRP
jgi:hypothetical protein